MIAIGAMLLLCSMGAYSQEFHHPYHDGTTQVYFMRDDPDYKLFRHFRTDVDGELIYHCFETRFSGDEDYSLTIVNIGDSALHIPIAQPRDYGGMDLPDGFPLRPPLADTITLQREDEVFPAAVVRKFDTTIAGETLSAFILAEPATPGASQTRHTIVERYGVVLMQGSNGKEVYLHSMESDEVSYNWETVKRRPYKLCGGDIRQYREREQCAFTTPPSPLREYYHTFTTTSTLSVDGVVYYDTYLGWLREGHDGVYILIDSTRSRMVVSNNLTIGTPVYFHSQIRSYDAVGSACVAFVVDTVTEERFGEERFVAKLATRKGVNDYPFCFPVEEIIDEIGVIIKRISRCTHIDVYEYSLTYAQVCNDTYGSLVSTQPVPETTAFALSPAYPNPLRTGSSAVLELHAQDGGTAYLALYNEAGLRLRVWTEECVPGTQPIHLNTAGLSPGAYRLRATRGAATASTAIIVR